MALPVTISGISTAVACVGPFKSSNIKSISAATSSGTNVVSLGNVSANQKVGQTFTTVGAIDVTAIAFSFGKNGSPTDDVTVDIFATSGGNPTGTSLGTSNAIGSASIGNVVTFTFPTPIALSATTLYAAVLSRSGAVDGTNFFSVTGTAASTYSGGTPLTYNGSSWSQPSGDLWMPVCIAGDAYFFFGRDGTTSTILQAFKATDPASSWASAASNGMGGVGTDPITNLAGFQVGDLVHLLVGQSAASTTTKGYLAFDMAAEGFTSTGEAVLASVNTAGQTGAQQSGGSLVVRANGDVVAFYNSVQTKTSGTYRARVSYRERTGVNTWGTETRVDANTAVDNYYPASSIGTSDRVHFLWNVTVGSRSLSDANALDTAQNKPTADVHYPLLSGSKIFSLGTTIAAGQTRASYGTSAANMTWTDVNLGGTSSSRPGRMFLDGSTLHALYRVNTDSDLYWSYSTDDGVNWNTATDIFTGTVAAAEANLSMDGNIYRRGDYFVIPYVVNDNGTLKYNEYQVRAVPIALTATSLATAHAALGTPTLLPLVAFYATPLGTAAPYLTAVPAISKGSGMPQLTAVSLASAHAALDTPALTQKHVLTATSLATAQAALGTPAITQKHILTATSLATAQDALGAPTLLPTSILSATSLATKQAALDTPAITQKHALTATSLATQQAVLGSPAITQKHLLAATSLATAQDALGAPVLLQTNVLSATSLASKQAALDSPVITQKHVLSATSLATQQAALGTPPITQKHILAATSLATVADGFDTPTLSVNVIQLTATSLATKQAALDSPAITQKHNLTATSLATAQAALGTPAISQKHVLTATSLATKQDGFDTPTVNIGTIPLTAISLATQQAALGTPAITQGHVVTATSLATKQAALDAPAISQKHVLAATSLATAQDALGAPTLAQTNVLAAISLATKQAALDSPAITQKHILTAISLATAQAVLAAPAITQKHLLAATSLATAQDALGTPTLTVGVINLTATSLATQQAAFGAPTLGLKINFTATSLATAQAGLDTPAIGQKHVLNATSLATAQAALGTPAFTQGIIRVPATRDASLSGSVPTVTLPANIYLTPPQADLALSPTAPIMSGAINRVPDTRDLGLSPTAPTVAWTDNHTITPDSRDLTLSEVAPVVFNSVHHPITVPQANIALSSLPPQLLPGSYVYPNPDQLAISTTPPIITRARLHHWRTPSTARAVVGGETDLRGSIELTP